MKPPQNRIGQRRTHGTNAHQTVCKPPNGLFRKKTQESEGTWCSGITSAPHAEGPGFKSQCVQFRKHHPSLSPPELKPTSVGIIVWCTGWVVARPDQGLKQLRQKSAPGRVRTCDEKGLRDRNSPMCTLSQNGYGDIGCPTKILPALAGRPRKNKNPNISTKVFLVLQNNLLHPRRHHTINAEVSFYIRDRER